MQPWLLAGVVPVEHRGPHTLGIGGFPKLPHGPVGIRRPGDALLRLRATGVGPDALEDHALAVPTTFEREQHTGIVHPGLVPDLPRRIVRIEAFTGVSPAI